MKKKKNILLILFIYLFFLPNINALSSYLAESPQWQSNLTNVSFGSTAFGDIDNDGDLDLVLTGHRTSSIAKVYINNGSTLNENSSWQQNFTGVNYGSLAFGDIDNDGDLDLALGGCSSGGNGLVATCNEGGYQTFIYINNGTSFTESSQWQNNLTKSWKGSLTFGDIDNDGDLDLALSGASSTGKISKIYINNGTSLVESSQWQNNLTAVYESALAFGDIDNDGDLDLVLCGDYGISNEISKIYLNNKTSFVENTTWQQNLLGVDWCSLAFGDYDNDGDLDLTLIGHTNHDNHEIYNNTGITFEILQSEETGTGSLIGIYTGSLAFGDYDNDGDLDLVTTGNEGYTTLYLYNTSSSNFTTYSQDPENLPDLDYGSTIVWADIDNDLDLDLIETGANSIPEDDAYIYLSNRSLTKNNTIPNASTSDFSSSYSNGILNLSWGNGTDAETPTLGLYYNLMLGNSTDNHTIVSGIYGGSSNPTAGYFGNMMQRKSITLNVELQANETHYWYVQTIDTGLAKSDWSAVQSFNTSADTTKPEITIKDPSPSAGAHTTNATFTFNVTVTDANVDNVTLFADWTGSMIVNETNSSGFNGTYIFTKNLTGYNDGMYSWYIEANDSSNNSQTSTQRSFYLDRTYPVVNSISPASGSTSTSASLTFNYNVTDTDIANCSLIIDSSVDQTDTTITENTTQTFTKTMSNGNYTWYVNCTDYVNYQNSSGSRSLTVSVSSTPPSGGGSSGGSSGTTTSFWSKTEVVSDEDFKNGFEKELSVKSRVKVSVGSEAHYVGVVGLTSLTATINISSDSIQVTLGIGEDIRVDVLDDGFYDVYVLLNNISDDKVNLTIQLIHEEIPQAEESVETSGNISNGNIVEEEEIGKRNLIWVYVIVGFVGLIIVVGIIFLTKFKKYRKWRKHTFVK